MIFRGIFTGWNNGLTDSSSQIQNPGHMKGDTPVGVGGQAGG